MGTFRSRVCPVCLIRLVHFMCALKRVGLPLFNYCSTHMLFRNSGENSTREQPQVRHLEPSRVEPLWRRLPLRRDGLFGCDDDDDGRCWGDDSRISPSGESARHAKTKPKEGLVCLNCSLPCAGDVLRMKNRGKKRLTTTVQEHNISQSTLIFYQRRMMWSRNGLSF